MLRYLKRSFLLILSLLSLTVFSQSSNPVGTAYLLGNDCYVITSDINWQLGAVWFNDQLNLEEPFEIDLSVYLGANDGGADGIVFVLQQVGTSAIGESGGGLGFEGFSPSLGIELDTFQNMDFGDPIADHMAVLQNGSVNHDGALNLAGPVSISPSSANVEDNQNHLFKLKWDPTTQNLEVFFDCELRLTYNGDIVNQIFNGDENVFWGFTGSTGGLSNIQSVCISEFALGLQENYQICEEGTVQLGVTGGQDGTYSWSPAEFLDDSNSPTPIASPDETTIFTVTYTDICGEEIELETLVEVAILDIDIPELFSICEGEIATIEVDGEADVFTWSNGDSGQSITVEEAGDLSVVAEIGSCSITVETEVEFLPVPNFTSLESEYIACQGDVVVLDGSTTLGVDYSWSSGSLEAIIEVETTGTYEITATTIDGCSTSLSTDVLIVEYPDPNLPEFVIACDGEVVSLVAGEADSYLWNIGSTNSILNVGTGGVFSVELETSGCISFGETEVIFNPLPDFNWVSLVDFCDGNSVWLELPNSDFEWLWQGNSVLDSVEVTGTGTWELIAVDPITNCSSLDITTAIVNSIPIIELPTTGVICDDRPLTVIAVTDAPQESFWNDGTMGNEIVITTEGVYVFSTSNECGTNSSEIIVTEELCFCPMYIPNAFTPNLDGVNELFKPEIGCEIRNYRFAIYNRWGQIIFETFELNEGWNGVGFANTHWVEDELYSYQVTYEVDLFDGVEVVNEFGTVQVIR